MLIEWLSGIASSSWVLSEFKKYLIDFATPKSNQLLITISLFLLYLILLFLKIRNEAHQQKGGLWSVLTFRDGCKIMLIVLSIVIYVARLTDTVQLGGSGSLPFGMDENTDIMVFFVGIILSEIIANRLIQSKGERFLLNYINLALLILFLALTSVIHADIQFTYKYYSQARWTGLWMNPNTYGLLMGMGLVLSCGMVALPIVWFPKLKSIFCTIAVGMMGIGLWQSYSRGAWMAFLCGFSYLGFHAPPFAGQFVVRTTKWLRPNAFTILVALCSLAILAFWQFHDTEHKVARRMLSIGNVNDFSWRNRVAAWEGSLAMIADRPCLGFGWGISEPTHDKYYRTAKIEEGMAVQLNDYFNIGTTLGLPALACFLCYVGLSFSTNRQKQNTPYDWSRTTCRAGALVLLVGFWFDGGLFKMATSVPFWILLELGTTESTQRNTPVPPQELSQKDLYA
jgi:O-antigen ligase